jgi:DtxR family transcriptional regulator, Mn-dependent transcriptional regulator
MLSKIEENYLKAIYKVIEKHGTPASTNHVARELETSAASVTDMMKRLDDKGYVAYERYRGVNLSDLGYKHARGIIRRHRLWEVFLYDKLKYTSKDALKALLKQLNYIKSDDITDRLDEFLNYPKFNYEGLAIPDKEGDYEHRSQFALSDMDAGEEGILVGIEDLSEEFFNFLNKFDLKLGSRITVLERYSFDESIKIVIEGKNEHIVTNKVACSLIMKKAMKKK